MAVTISLPDGSKKEFPSEPSVLDVAKSIGPRLAKDTLGAVIDNEKDIIDLRSKIKNGTSIKIVTVKDKVSLEVIRHSAAHVMAQAVQELWPKVKVTIGPVIENGFFYDFDSPHAFTPEDLEKIEKKMQEICKKDYAVTREEWQVDEAIQTFEKMGEKYKVELIAELKNKGEKTVSIYHQGPWFDLCRGPHVQHLGQIPVMKVLSLAGAYWRGDEKREQLQRIYATAFLNEADLKKHLHELEEAKKRDHRRLGKDLGLFIFHHLAPGSPFFTPNGTVIYNELQRFLRDKYQEHNYQEVITPQIFDIDLFHQSGHYENYRENMYFSKIEERDFGCKPMNCPGHCLLYGSDHRSYRDLPWRVADFGRLHRYERSGVMHGLTRVRSFSQDDAHIFCALEQLQAEIEGFMQFLNEVYTTLGMTKYHVYLSTRPPKRMGSDEVWDKAEAALEKALKQLNIEYTVNIGDGAFYGPKLDIMFVDAINRPWQLGTLQCDFNLPQAFSLKYVGDDNAEHAPVMLHRAILGSFERFIGVYLEHTAGHLPFWLSPIQVRVLNVTDRQLDYSAHLEKELKALGIRAYLDGRNEKLGYKIREAQLLKVPYMLVIGDKEKDTDTISVRLSSGEMVNNLKKSDFFEMLEKEYRLRSLKSLIKPKQGEKV
ncbi:MAG: threonine--tRNA ligase [Bdellovibrionales bacterium RBG_16_40_8]|nr:MAG: threonine--tRNA ligase [Bdellovibrionales bacterium RBG_16_40_8]